MNDNETASFFKRMIINYTLDEFMLDATKKVNTLFNIRVHVTSEMEIVYVPNIFPEPAKFFFVQSLIRNSLQFFKQN